jgi:hypothetical protein
MYNGISDSVGLLLFLLLGVYFTFLSMGFEFLQWVRYMQWVFVCLHRGRVCYRGYSFFFYNERFFFFIYGHSSISQLLVKPLVNKFIHAIVHISDLFRVQHLVSLFNFQNI